MKRIITATAFALCIGIGAWAQDAPKAQVTLGGFIRNYATFDTHESYAGIEDFFYYQPKDQQLNADGDDVLEYNTLKFAALTSRLWVTTKGYQIAGIDVDSRIELDFYAGVNKYQGTATARLRQAWVGLQKDAWRLQIGQAWHPLAADQPYVLAQNTGTPFNAIGRCPQVQFGYKFGDNFSVLASALAQMQWGSNGPNGNNAQYQVWACVPEFYAGANYMTDHLLFRLGADVLTIKPVRDVKGTLTTVTPMFYGQYKQDGLKVSGKLYWGHAGEHMYLPGGYGIAADYTSEKYKYTASSHLTGWLAAVFGTKIQGALFVGYSKNLGTSADLFDRDNAYWFSTNGSKNQVQLYRVVPSFIYNLGKLTFGIEYELTSVQYGDGLDQRGLATKDYHWVANHRILSMVKYTF